MARILAALCVAAVCVLARAQDVPAPGSISTGFSTRFAPSPPPVRACRIFGA
jgi:hypothetical protein